MISRSPSLTSSLRRRLNASVGEQDDDAFAAELAQEQRRASELRRQAFEVQRDQAVAAVHAAREKRDEAARRAKMAVRSISTAAPGYQRLIATLYELSLAYHSVLSVYRRLYGVPFHAYLFLDDDAAGGLRSGSSVMQRDSAFPATAASPCLRASVELQALHRRRPRVVSKLFTLARQRVFQRTGVQIPESDELASLGKSEYILTLR